MESISDNHDNSIRQARFQLASQHLPEHVRRLCSVDGTGVTSVRLFSDIQASEDELILLAGLGYRLDVFAHSETGITNAENDLFVDPGLRPKKDSSGTIDLERLSRAIPAFKIIRFGGRSSSILGWEALEGAVAVEDLTLINPPRPLDLSHLPRLHRVSLEGWNAISALTNPNVIGVSLYVSKMRPRFTIDHPIHDLFLEISSGDVDLNFVRDRSELTWLSVSGGATISLGPLRDAPRLRELDLYGCKRVTEAHALTTLDSLVALEFDGVRAIDNLDSIRQLNLTRFKALRNYTFDDEFIDEVSTRPGWLISKFRGPKGEPVKSAIDADFSHMPFSVQKGVGGQFHVIFDDWEALSERLESSAPLGYSLNVGMDELAQAILERDDPAMLQENRVEFDSEGTAMHIVVDDQGRANRIASVLRLAWDDRGRTLELIRDLT